ncbi:MAG: flagellar biosynthesis chaperone FliJ [Lentimonas sp.]|jgi:flagellar biosynthesis chaperone FliJ
MPECACSIALAERSEAKALEHLQAQFDEREACLQAAESVLREREAFIEKSENTISEQGQQLQEWEAELENLHDELKGEGTPEV